MGRAMVTVAAETGQDPFALLDRPLWQLLYTFHHLEERAARRALARRLERVDAGLMVSRAFNEPASLEDELRSVQQAIEEQDRPPAAPANLDALRQRGERMIARLEAGRVLSPEALVS